MAVLWERGEPDFMDDVPSTNEVVAFLSGYPPVVLEAVSLYYPLGPDWMRKYGDILYWGNWFNADISDSASLTYYTPGIVFNSSVKWTDEVRALVAANLAFKGGDVELRSWENLVQGKPTVYGENVLQHAEALVKFVASCPRTIRTLAAAEAAALHAHQCAYYEEPSAPSADAGEDELQEYGEECYNRWSFMHEVPEGYVEEASKKYAPTITTPLSWETVVNMFAAGTVPMLLANPDLWHKTLSQLMTQDVVRTLLNIFYWQHLNDRLKRPAAGEDVPWPEYTPPLTPLTPAPSDSPSLCSYAPQPPPSSFAHTPLSPTADDSRAPGP
jgi:hypothetical protein